MEVESVIMDCQKVWNQNLTVNKNKYYFLCWYWTYLTGFFTANIHDWHGIPSNDGEMFLRLSSGKWDEVKCSGYQDFMEWKNKKVVLLPCVSRVILSPSHTTLAHRCQRAENNPCRAAVRQLVLPWNPDI